MEDRAALAIAAILSDELDTPGDDQGVEVARVLLELLLEIMPEDTPEREQIAATVAAMVTSV